MSVAKKWDDELKSVVEDKGGVRLGVLSSLELYVPYIDLRALVDAAMEWERASGSPMATAVRFAEFERTRERCAALCKAIEATGPDDDTSLAGHYVAKAIEELEFIP